MREDPVDLCRCKVHSKVDGDWSLERSQERGTGRLRVAVVRKRTIARDVKGPVFERRAFHRESAAHAKAPGVGSRLSMLEEYEETSCVCSKVVKTRY